MKRALYPGTFDPLHNGHVDLLGRSARMFDHITVAVADSARKGTLFGLEDRLEMVREACGQWDNVDARSFSGMLVDEFERSGVDVVIRGVRLLQDFEYEYTMALMNRRLHPRFDVVFLMPSEEVLSLSSSLIKDIHHHGGDISSLVPASVAARMGGLA